MIEARFGLKARPFDKSIPSRDLYTWPGLEELDARLDMAKRSRGIMLLTGEPGTDKTVALRRFVDGLNAEHYLPVYLPLSTVTVLDAYAQLNRALGGQLKANVWIMLCYASGNRDEEIFPEPDRFNIDRTPNRQLAFGNGAHVCLGQHLARMEMRILFEEWMPRLKSVSLDGEPRYSESFFVNGLKTLPIKFELT